MPPAKSPKKKIAKIQAPIKPIPAAAAAASVLHSAAVGGFVTGDVGPI